MSDTRREEFLAFHRPTLGEEEIAEVVDTLRSGWLTMGPKTARFEEKFAAAIGAEHAVAVSSCTAGLHLVLAALDLGPGDEVITTPYTFPATVAAIIYTGATPILADTYAQYPNIDADAVAARVTSRTKAIMPVHFAGASCAMDQLREIAAGCSATLVEDAAHGVGGSYRGVPIGGGTSEAAVFSLYAGKNITTGEGGMVTTSNGELADAVRIRRLHGISRDAWKRYTAVGSWYYEVETLGYKYNMTDINAAIGLHQLDRVEAFQARRRELVARYNEKLADIDGVILPVPPSDTESAWHLYIVRLAEGGAERRGEVIEALREDNIGTSVHFIPAHHHPEFQGRFGWTPDVAPNATRLYEASISLPLYPGMSDEDVDSVARSLERILSEKTG